MKLGSRGLKRRSVDVSQIQVIPLMGQTRGEGATESIRSASHGRGSGRHRDHVVNLQSGRCSLRSSLRGFRRDGI